MTQPQRERLQDIAREFEADATTLGFEARELARRNAEKIRKFLDDFDTIQPPAPPRESSVPPASEAHP